VKIVPQIDRKGCGLACIAMVTGKRYELVKKYATLAGNWRPSYGMNGAMLQHQLDRLHRTVLGVTGRFTRCYTTLAIVKINAFVSDGDRVRKMQHWVVWHNGSVYDPATGIAWIGSEEVDGLRLYLASVGSTARTGRWYWV
jgi:hypothetical protein